MRLDQIKSSLAHGVFAVQQSYLTTVVGMVNDGNIEAKETSFEVAESHSYEVIGDTAVIAIDGAMIKKNSWMNASCGGFVAYDTIVGYIEKAEADASIKRMLFRVDTVGGDVNGVDEVGDRIFTSPKETITLYENVGASAGIWAFTASDKVYATEVTQLGSIGVMSTMRTEEEDDTKITIVSRNAENKNCSLNGSCKEKAQAMINQYEEIFHARVERNTGFTADMIVDVFNSGETVFAKEALRTNFIDGIMSYDDLIKSVGTIPTAPQADKIANTNLKGEKMKLDAMTQDSLDALVAENKSFSEQLVEATSGADTLKIEADKVPDLIAKIATLEEGASAKADTTKQIVAMAFEKNMGKDTALAMIEKDTVAEAGMLVLEAQESAGGSDAGDIGSDTGSKEDAEANFAMSVVADINKA